MAFNRMPILLIAGMFTLLMQGDVFAWLDAGSAEGSAGWASAEPDAGYYNPVGQPATHQPRASLTTQTQHRSTALYDRSGQAAPLIWLERLAKRIAGDLLDDSATDPAAVAMDTRMREAAYAHQDHAVTEVSRRGLQTSGRHPPHL